MKIKVDKLKAALRDKYELFKRFLEDDDNDALFLLHMFSVAFGLFMVFLMIAFVCWLPMLIVVLGTYVVIRMLGYQILDFFSDENERKNND